MLKCVKLKEGEKGLIELFDKERVHLIIFDLVPGLNEINLYENKLPSGTYTYNVIINDNITETKNLVIISN